MNDDLHTEPGGDGWFGDPVALGATMGRYQLRALVGAGGMGVVFEALDPELDRSVAVKVLRTTAGKGSEGEARLRREGQTMARLTHPNVIRVYDVGIPHGHLFVAMEFIAGGTLADWLEQTPRTAAEILAVFVQAGRGLAAAHDAGLVHRDFKPSNVLVGRDGRVLVTDFGLARPATATADAPVEAGVVDEGRLGIAATLTRAGQFVGTPAYMAPEQYSGEPVDARADQFGFCVALWRALYGTAPYDGRTVEELAASTGSGDLMPPPPGASSRVSPAVRAALERGLRSEPAERFPAMHELLAVIEPRPSRRRLYAGIATGGVIVAGAVAWSLLAGHSTADPCPAPDPQIAAVWSDARKTTVRAHLAQVDPATGTPRFVAAAAMLDRSVPAWRTMHVAACRATRVDGKQSDTLLDARMRCLTEWIDQVGAVVTGLETAADPDAVEGAVKSVSSLPTLDRCADLVALQAASQLPTAPAEHAEALAILDEAKQINVQRKTGKREGLAERTDALLVRARKLGNPATLAKVLAVRWRLAAHGGDMVAAIDFLHELTEVAARGHDDTEAAYAWSLMGRLTAMTQNKPEQAKVMMTAARAAVARAGDDPDLAASVLTDQADVLNAARDEAGAMKALAEARVLLDKLGAGEPGSPHAAKLAGLLQTQSNAYWFANQLDAAVPPLREAIALYDRAYGPDTLDAAAGYLDLAQVLRDAMKLDEAAVAVKEAIRIRQQRTGESGALAMALIVQADIQRNSGHVADGLATAERAVAIATAAMPAGDGQLIDLQLGLAEHRDAAGQLEPAAALYRDTLAEVERQDMTNVNVVMWWLNYGDLERRLGHCKDAMAHFKKAGEIARALEGETSIYLGGALRGEAQCLVATGDKAGAIDRLERAEKYEVPANQAADAALARGVLGMLRADTGKDRAGGIALARESLAQAKALNDARAAADPRIPQLETWLARQR